MDSRLTTLLLVVALGLGVYFMFFHKSSEAPATHASVAAIIPAATDRPSPEQMLTLETGGLSARVSTYSAALRRVQLTDPQFRDLHTHQPMDLEALNYESVFPLRTDVSFERDGHTNILPPYLTFTVAHANAHEVELVATPPNTDVEVRRVIRAHGQYAFAVTTTVVNHGAPGRMGISQGVYHWVKRTEESSQFFRQPWQRSEAMCRRGNGLLRDWRDDVGKPGKDGGRDASFVAVGNLYFLSALAVADNAHPDCILRSEDRGSDAEGKPTGSVLHALLVWHPSQLAQNESRDVHVIAYFGPKFGQTLEAASPVLHEAVNLGFFALIARALLKLLVFLHSVVRNWGLAIMLLTLIVRTALFPILARSMKSMAAMQRLKPEIDAINEKFKDNQEQKGLATMELYRKHKINPLGGCLPQVAQLPIWWALYTTLQTSVELFHAPFVLWLRDLSAPDPFFVLPLILGAVMFLQQKLMPASMPDPTQQKMMLYFMPIFLTGISLFLPAGLALYMLVNSVLAMAQQRITKAQIDRMALATPQGAIDVRVLDTKDSPSDKSGKGSSSKNGGRRGGRR